VFSTKFFAFLRKNTRALLLYIQIAALAFASVFSVAFPQNTSAALLTSRKATISTSAPSATDVEFIFSYTLPNTTSTKAGIIYEFCTSPLGTCNALGWTLSGATQDSQTAWPNNATNFAKVTGGADVGDCNFNSAPTTEICFSRDETVATGVTGGAVTHTISGINFNSTIQTGYIRISIYSDNDFQTADLLDQGVVAVAVVRQLVTYGRVQERLEFCVAAIDDDDTLPANCAAMPSTTTIDIGVVDNSSIAYAPVEPSTTNGANDAYGLAMINTNAAGGVVLTYFPEVDTNVAGGDTHQLRSFRVANADCNATATITTDQCFVSASTAGETFTAGTERFGIYIPCIDTSQGTTTNLGAAGAGTGVSGTYNQAYDGGDANLNSLPDCEAEIGTTDFAYDDSGTPATLVSSTSVVDDEIVKISFGATASATTPTGLYRVTTTYVATPTF